MRSNIIVLKFNLGNCHYTVSEHFYLINLINTFLNKSKRIQRQILSYLYLLIIIILTRKMLIV